MIRTNFRNSVQDASTFTLIYDGDVRVYLQGRNALQPFGDLDQNHISYFIGTDGTNLLIRDFRLPSVMAAKRILGGETDIVFTDQFNKTAHAEVYYSECESGLEINLSESTDNEISPILWIGVLKDGEMPAYKVEWEIYKEISADEIAFTALVP